MHKIPKMLDPQTKNNLLHIVLELDAKTTDAIFSDTKKRFKSVITKEMVNHINEFGLAPIYLAAKRGDLAATVFLLEMKANPNVQNKDGFSPLMIAACHGHFKVIGSLLSSNADPFLKNNRHLNALHQAAINNHLLALNSLLLNDPQAIIKSEDHDGYTALHYAAKGDKNGTLVKFLIEKKAEVNKLSSENGATPFMVAAMFNQIEAAKSLLSLKADACIVNQEGSSAMRFAIFNGHIEFLKFLLISEIVAADFISSLAQNELLPVHAAVRGNQTAMLKFLLTSNPEMVNLSDQLGATSLHLATDSPTLTQLLLEYKADPNVQDYLGATPLMLACWLGRKEIVHLTLTASKIKYDFSISDNEGRTALYFAASCGYVSIGERLLNAGDVSAGKLILQKKLLSNDSKLKEITVSIPRSIPRVSAKKGHIPHKLKHGDSPFHAAVANNHAGFVKLLLKHKTVDPDLPNKTGCTALLYSINEGNETMALTLIENKADINYNFANNIRPLHIAIRRKQTTLLSKILNERNIEINAGSPLSLAAEIGNEEAVCLLISNKADLNLSFRDTTPLSLAAVMENDRIVKLLLDAKADHTQPYCSKGLIPLLLVLKKTFFPNSDQVIGLNYWETLRYLIQVSPNIPLTPAGHTALHLSVNANKPLLVQKLLEYSVDVNAQTILEKETSLHLAARCGYLEIAKLLAQFNADLNLQLSSTGDTPLHLGVYFNFLDIVALLVKNKADLNIRNVDGQTALLLAQRYKNTAIEELLSSLNLTNLEKSENKKESKNKVKTQGKPYNSKKHLTNTSFFSPPPIEKFDFGEYGTYVEIKSDDQKIGIRRLKNHGLNTHWFIMITDAILNKIMSEDSKISDTILRHLRAPILVQHGPGHKQTGFVRGNERLGDKNIYLKLSLSKLTELRLFSTRIAEKQGKLLFILDHFEKLHGRTTAQFRLIKNGFVLASTEAVYNQTFEQLYMG